MTVTPANVEQIPGVIGRNRSLGYNLFSFQPAAHVGDEGRWNGDYHSLDPERVWHQIERGAGSPLPHQLFQIGDERCNRTAFGFYVGDALAHPETRRIVPACVQHSVLDPEENRELKEVLPLPRVRGRTQLPASSAVP
jgi:hypothetical protein